MGCINDGHEPLYMKQNPSLWIYAKLEDCCDRYYGWIKRECMGLEDVPTGLFYPNWEEQGSVKCLNDENAPAYMTNNQGVWMFASATACEL